MKNEGEMWKYSAPLLSDYEVTWADLWRGKDKITPGNSKQWWEMWMLLRKRVLGNVIVLKEKNIVKRGYCLGQKKCWNFVIWTRKRSVGTSHMVWEKKYWNLVLWSRKKILELCNMALENKYWNLWYGLGKKYWNLVLSSLKKNWNLVYGLGKILEPWYDLGKKIWVRFDAAHEKKECNLE